MSDETRGSDAAAPSGGDARDDYTSERDSAVSTARKRHRAEGESEEDDACRERQLLAISMAPRDVVVEKKLFRISARTVKSNDAVNLTDFHTGATLLGFPSSTSIV